MIPNWLLHQIYLFGYQRRILPRSLRRLLPRSEIHRAWLRGYCGVFEQGGINYGLANPYRGDDLTNSQALPFASGSEIWRTPTPRIVFLDFDGVLHRKQTGTFEHLELFEQWLLQFPDVGVVITSTWRNAERSYLETIFSHYMRDRLIGRTAPEDVFSRRQDEILDWMSKASGQPFVVLDDDLPEFDRNWPHLIPTDYETGLTEHHIEVLSLWANDPDGMP